MMNKNGLDELKAEFDKFVHDSCATDDCNKDDRDIGDKADEEPVPAFVEQIAQVLLAPSRSGVYLSRLDIKRVAEAIDESLAIKERNKMVKALFRHTTTKKYLEDAFAEINLHINGRILIYEELAESFPASKEIFESHINKCKKTSKMFTQIAEDFEEIDPTIEPLITSEEA